MNKGCQADDDAIPLYCEECEYPLDTLYDLGEHMGELHSGFKIPCNSCSDIFSTPESLKEHNTEIHEAHHMQDEDYSFNCEY